MKIYTIFILIVGAISCTNPNSTSTTSDLKKEITKLTTIESQSSFLTAIYQLDQQVRQESRAALEKYGHESKESQAAEQKVIRTDEELQNKIDLYLSIHGHPSLNKHGKEATDAPWVVCQHYPYRDDGFIKRNFKHLYKASKLGDISTGQLTFLLNRRHEIEFQQRIKWNRPFNEAEELDTLLKALKYKELQSTIDHQLQNQ